jgi:hypothetical protein
MPNDPKNPIKQEPAKSGKPTTQERPSKEQKDDGLRK